jgi:hypothetical protein
MLLCCCTCLLVARPVGCIARYMLLSMVFLRPAGPAGGSARTPVGRQGGWSRCSSICFGSFLFCCCACLMLAGAVGCKGASLHVLLQPAGPAGSAYSRLALLAVLLGSQGRVCLASLTVSQPVPFKSFCAAAAATSAPWLLGQWAIVSNMQLSMVLLQPV